MTAPAEDVPVVELAYGPAVDQRGDLRVPAGDGPHPVVVTLHGGFWQLPWDRRLMNALCADLAARGIATWNVEYARTGQRRGGWPGTFEDVANAVDHLDVLAAEHALDVERVVVLGHSAGGHLALWTASRAGLPAGAPGAKPRVRPCAVVSLAGIGDLAAAARDGVGGGAVAGLLGGDPDKEPERYALASPYERLPLGVPQLLVHGDEDEVVPLRLAAAYQARARELGDDCELAVAIGSDQFGLLDPADAGWDEVLRSLSGRLGIGGAG